MADDFVARIRAELDVTQFKAELQSIVSEADAAISRLTSQAIASGDSSTLAGLAAGSPKTAAEDLGVNDALRANAGTTAAGRYDVNALAASQREILGGTGGVVDFAKLTAELNATGAALKSAILEENRIKYDKEGFPTGGIRPPDEAEYAATRARYISRANAPDIPLNPESNLGREETALQANAVKRANEAFVDALNKRTYNEYLISEEGRDVLEQNAREAAAFKTRVAAEDKITAELLNQSATYVPDRAAEAKSQQAISDRLRLYSLADQTSTPASSLPIGADATAAERQAAILSQQRLISETTRLTANRELLGLDTKQVAAGKSLLDIQAERKLTDSLIATKLKQQEQLIVKQNADYEQYFSGGTITQRILAGLKSRGTGAPVNPESQPELGQFLGQKVATTVGFGASALLTFGAFSLVSNQLKQVNDFEAALTGLQAQLIAIGHGDQFQGLKSSLLNISAETGQNLSDLTTLTQRFIGTYQNATYAAQQTEAVAKIAAVSGADLNTVAEAVQAASKNFGLTGKQLGDIGVQIQNAFGTPIPETLQFFGQVSPTASAYGFTAQQAAIVAGGLTSQSPSRSGASEAESLNRILPGIIANTQKLADFNNSLGGKKLFDTGALVSGDLSTVLQQILANYGNLDQASQHQLVNDLASSRNQKDVIALLDDRARVTQYLSGQLQLQGSLDAAFSQRQGSLKQTLSELSAAFLKLGDELYNSGLGTILKDVAEGLKAVVDAGDGIVSLFDKLGPFKEIILAAGGFLGAAKALPVLAKVGSSVLGEVSGSTGIVGGVLRGVGIGGAATQTAEQVAQAGIDSSKAQLATLLQERVALEAKINESTALAAGETDIEVAALGKVDDEIEALQIAIARQVAAANAAAGETAAGGAGAGAAELAPAAATLPILPLAALAAVAYVGSKYIPTSPKINNSQVDSAFAGLTPDQQQQQLQRQFGVDNPEQFNPSDYGQGFNLGDYAHNFFSPGGEIKNIAHAFQKTPSHTSKQDQIQGRELKDYEDNVVAQNQAALEDIVSSGQLDAQGLQDFQKALKEKDYKKSQADINNLIQRYPALANSLKTDLEQRFAGKNPKDLADSLDQAAQDFDTSAEQSIQEVQDQYQAGELGQGSKAYNTLKSQYESQLASLENGPLKDTAAAATEALKLRREMHAALIGILQTEATNLNNELQGGDISLSQYKAQIAEIINKLRTDGGPNGIAAAAALLKSSNQTVSAAIQKSIDDQVSILQITGGKGGNVEAQAENLYLSALNNPQLSAQDKQGDVVKALQAEQQKFNDYVSNLPNDAAKLAALKAGWKIPSGLTKGLLFTALTDVGGAYIDTVQQIATDLNKNANDIATIVAQIATSQNKSVNEVLATILLARVVADKAAIEAARKAQVLALEAIGSTNVYDFAALRKGLLDAGARLQADEQAYNAALNAPTLAPTTSLAGNAQSIGNDSKAAASTAKEDAKAYREALNALYQAQDALDPIKLAQDEIALAQQHYKDAALESTPLQQAAARLRALAEEKKADTSLIDAMFATQEAQISLAKAYADAAGDTVASARDALRIAQDEVAKLLQEGAKPGSKPLVDAQIGVVSAAATLRDNQIQAQEDTINFNLAVKNISTGAAIAQYKGLLAQAIASHESIQKIREIEQQIYSLKQSIEGDLQFNLPSDLRLPTLYEARRFTDSGGGTNYQDNRNVQITITTAASAKDVLNVVTNALNAPPRFGTRPGAY